MQRQTRILLDFPLPEERIFRYQAMQDILHHLVNNPLEAFTQKELATITGADVSSISRSVALLEQLGILDIGGNKPARIQIAQDHLKRDGPLFSIPQKEFRKPVQAYLNELTTAIDNSDGIDELAGVILFGSVARGTADRSSDIDLLVVVEGDGTYGRRIASQIASDLEERSIEGDRYQFEVLAETVTSAASYGEKLQEIFNEGIILQRTGALQEVRQAVYGTDHGGENDADHA